MARTLKLQRLALVASLLFVHHTCLQNFHQYPNVPRIIKLQNMLASIKDGEDGRRRTLTVLTNNGKGVQAPWLSVLAKQQGVFCSLFSHADVDSFVAVADQFGGSHQHVEDRWPGQVLQRRVDNAVETIHAQWGLQRPKWLDLGVAMVGCKKIVIFHVNFQPYFSMNVQRLDLLNCGCCADFDFLPLRSQSLGASGSSTSSQHQSLVTIAGGQWKLFDPPSDKVRNHKADAGTMLILLSISALPEVKFWDVHPERRIYTGASNVPSLQNCNVPTYFCGVHEHPMEAYPTEDVLSHVTKSPEAWFPQIGVGLARWDCNRVVSWGSLGGFW